MIYILDDFNTTLYLMRLPQEASGCQLSLWGNIAINCCLFPFYSPMNGKKVFGGGGGGGGR
jgi:hypothetical protein